MIKILLADDEKWVRTTIKDALPFEKLELELVGEASNGLEAFELSLKHLPNILLTDIKMPGMDGLELITKLKELYPHLLTIIISGYNEFEYAKKALQLGAFDYLLKPVDEENMTEVLVKAKNHIQKEHEKLETEKLLEHQYKTCVPVIREGLLNDIMNDNAYSLDEIKRYFESYNIKLNSSTIGVIINSIDDYIKKIQNLPGKNKQAVMTKFKKIVGRAASKYIGGIAFFNKSTENELVVIYSMTSSTTLSQLQRILTNLQKIIYRRLNITFSIGVSSNGIGIGRISKLYTEAADALNYRMINGNGSINYFRSIKALRAKEFHLSKDIVNDVVLNIELLNEQNVKNIHGSIFEQLNLNADTTPEMIKTAFWAFILDVVNGLNCKDFPSSKLYEFNNTSFYEDYKRLVTIDDIKNYLLKFFIHMLSIYFKNAKPDNRSVVETAKAYIDNNYHKEITLALISSYVFVNSSYFSELFKKEIGQNFIEYLTNLRIEKAKELLNKTNLKTYEVCEKVGYSDTKYFSKLFKRLVGVTPSDYKSII